MSIKLDKLYDPDLRKPKRILIITSDDIMSIYKQYSNIGKQFVILNPFLHEVINPNNQIDKNSNNRFIENSKYELKLLLSTFVSFNNDIFFIILNPNKISYPYWITYYVDEIIEFGNNINARN